MSAKSANRRRRLVQWLVLWGIVVICALITQRAFEPRPADEEELMRMMYPLWMSHSEPTPPALEDAEIIRWIKRFKAVNYYSPRQNSTMLTCAVHNNRRVVVAYLLEAGADPNPAKGSVPIHSAIPDKEMVELLLAHGADINRPGIRTRRTLLHFLVEEHPRGLVRWIKWAVSQGADPTLRDASGETPREIALRLNLSEVAQVLQAAEEAQQQRPKASQRRTGPRLLVPC